ncbi:unnamed protein product [Phytophthora fragariaefolia]|uniref:Unnamed protein product n=1 Tax=Phytophthora fragariaefolia TaxID=1490495 RepID=A0A9W6XZT4_9STRA|nr:unnamed protein product [Phytophthora fragariaefolia]
MIYQRIIDNARWGYVQPRGGWESCAGKVRRAEAASATQRGRLSDPNQPTPDSVNSGTKFEADHRALAESDPLQGLVNSPEGDMFANGEPDESTLTPVFDRRFAVLLSPYHVKVKRIRELDADFAQLLQATVTQHIGLDESLSHLAPPSKNSATERLDPELLYAHVPQDFVGHVLSFDGSAKTEKNGGYVNIAEYTGMNNGVMAALERCLTDLIIVGDSRPAIQQSMWVMVCKKEAQQLELTRHKKLADQLSSVRYPHVLRHYNAAADSLVTEALESRMGRVVLSSDRKTELKELNRVSEILYTSTDSAGSGEPRTEILVMTRRQTRRVHFEDEANKDSAGISQNTGLHDKEANSPNARAEGLHFESPRAPKRVRRVEAEVEVSEGRIPDATNFDPALDSLTHRRAQNASKIADTFVLSEDGLLYYQGQRRRRAEPDSADISLRLVVPTTMADEVLHSCHNSIEGDHQGIVRTFHRVKAELYWVELYADVSKHVQTCEDCSTSKSKPQLRGYSPGNVTSEYPFQLVSMDFVIPLPVTRRGNTALLLFQDHFPGLVIAKAMSETGALEVAKAFEECLRPRATLSYRPQANSQQEGSVKTMIQTVRAYVEDPLQADWDDIAEKMVHAINNSRDTTRRETPFYLVHGWDAQSTLKSMTSTIKRDSANSAGAAQWRREGNCQREIALQLAIEFLPESTQLKREISTDNEDADSEDEPAEPERSLFRAGDQVWLFMERDRPGLKKKLAHRWHGPFRVKKKVEKFAYELELPDKSGYRFYRVVHVSRLKKVADFGQRPTAKLVDELSESDRFDFDEELLPEDSCELSDTSDKYEVEAILDDKIPNLTSTSRAQRLFKVKWVGHDEPTWDPLSNISCGGLLCDYLRNKKRERRLQMVQVADDN